MPSSSPARIRKTPYGGRPKYVKLSPRDDGEFLADVFFEGEFFFFHAGSPTPTFCSLRSPDFFSQTWAPWSSTCLGTLSRMFLVFIHPQNSRQRQLHSIFMKIPRLPLRKWTRKRLTCPHVHDFPRFQEYY